MTLHEYYDVNKVGLVVLPYPLNDPLDNVHTGRTTRATRGREIHTLTLISPKLYIFCLSTDEIIIIIVNVEIIQQLLQF